ncbi:tetratricopeptide repeat protein [Thiomicrorhabdus sp.]|uniref:tetratricopeptide repeat protein n=1 Tax=Thiomicrorhabdus sp. TaxID=2039724 RepID=UPI002AA68AD1|nr:tetratricopeptide repeat protein [Thiomicrorhabdus sp.]
MSLIYNSLKQHEKKKDSQPKINPMSQRIRAQERKTFSKTSFLLIVSVSTAVCIVGLLIVQNYWGYQAKDEHVNSVHHLVLASNPQTSALSKESDLLSQEHQNIDLNTNQETTNETKNVVTQEIKEKSLVAKSNDALLKQDLQLTLASKEMVTAPTQSEISPKLATVSIQHNEQKIGAEAKSDKALIVKDKEVKPAEQIVQADSSTKNNGSEALAPDGLNEVGPAIKVKEDVLVASLTSKQEVNKSEVKRTEVSKVEVKQEPKAPQVLLKTEKLVVAKVANKPKPILAKTVVKNRVAKPIVTATEKGATFKKMDVKVAKSNAIQTDEIANKNTYEYFNSVKSKVAEIKQSIRLKNDKQVERHLNELKKLSGKDSVIYQRMDAYASLKKQHYQAAANSYQKLLNQKPEDMEANMNLVIALAELGDQQTAKQKLNRLDSMYPESSQLKQYKKMIHAKYGY